MYLIYLIFISTSTAYIYMYIKKKKTISISPNFSSYSTFIFSLHRC